MSGMEAEAKHELETPWTLYSDERQGHAVQFKDYERGLRKLGTVHTLEELWQYFSWVHRPDDMPLHRDVFFFRHNHIPAWEETPNGGCWAIRVRKRNGLINRMWEELVFAVASEQFGEPTVVGVELSCRLREDVISIWNSDNVKYPNVRFVIGEKLKTILNLDDTTIAEYKYFKAALQDGSTFRNAQAYVYAAAASKDKAAEKKAASEEEQQAPQEE